VTSTLELVYGTIQVGTFTVLVVMMGRAMLRRQKDMNAEGREIFRAFFWLAGALCISVIYRIAAGVQINPASVLVVASAAYCAYTLRRRKA
jgi:hypothetical protein